MRPEPLSAIWRRGGVALNGWLWVPSAFSAEIMAHQGFDSLTIDLQHGLIDYQAAVGMMQAIATTPTPTLVRVAWNEPGSIMKALDAGAAGIIAPMVNDASEAERLTRTCRYPPEGCRSLGPARAALQGGPDYVKRANAEVLVLPMIETAEGFDNLDEILSVPGISGVYVGPGDLAFALGREPRLDHVDPEMVAAQTRIAQACRGRGLVAGIHTGSSAYTAGIVEAGFNFVTVGSDSRFIATQAAAELKVSRAACTAARSAARGLLLEEVDVSR